jgi:3-oxoadipate CoA-transferase alpha subunit
VIDKRVATLADAVAGIQDGATVLVGGFGASGVPVAPAPARPTSPR